MQDEDNLREALRYSAAMLGELRTSLLTPQKYFELYMQAFDELRHLEVHRSTLQAILFIFLFFLCLRIAFAVEHRCPELLPAAPTDLLQGGALQGAILCRPV